MDTEAQKTFLNENKVKNKQKSNSRNKIIASVVIAICAISIATLLIIIYSPIVSQNHINILNNNTNDTIQLTNSTAKYSIEPSTSSVIVNNSSSDDLMVAKIAFNTKNNVLAGSDPDSTTILAKTLNITILPKDSESTTMFTRPEIILTEGLNSTTIVTTSGATTSFKADSINTTTTQANKPLIIENSGCAFELNDNKDNNKLIRNKIARDLDVFYNKSMPDREWQFDTKINNATCHDVGSISVGHFKFDENIASYNLYDISFYFARRIKFCIDGFVGSIKDNKINEYIVSFHDSKNNTVSSTSLSYQEPNVGICNKYIEELFKTDYRQKFIPRN